MKFDVTQTSGTLIVNHNLGVADTPYFVRVRGHDGNQVGTATPADPTPPSLDVLGSENPWADLWCYSNPVFVLTR